MKDFFVIFEFVFQFVQMYCWRLLTVVIVLLDWTQSLPASKRFAFTSRGWGASGVPWESSLWNSYPRIKSRRALPPPMPLQTVQTPSEDDGPSTLYLAEPPYPPSASQSAPQLFVSYGWGPLG